MKECHDFHPTAFSWTCIWAQCLAAFIASTTASPSSLATDPLASFTATVTLVVYGDHGAPLRVHNRTLEGCVFADGYHVRSQRVLDEGTYLYASALLTNTVYSLITASSPSGSTRYQAYLERGLVSRFFPRDHQVVALALSIADHWQHVVEGTTKILLSLGEPIPEYFNRYFVDRSQWPHRITVQARAPHFALCSTGIMLLPKPYDSGFTYWTLDVSYEAHRPVHARFRKYEPLDSAVEEVRSGRTPQRLEALSSSADVFFTLSGPRKDFRRLPVPPELPFKIADYRFAYDIYTNNRISPVLEGGAVLTCTNIDWSYPEDQALRISAFIQRGLTSRDAALQRSWLRFLFLAICVTVLAVPALLVWRRQRTVTPNHP